MLSMCGKKRINQRISWQDREHQLRNLFSCRVIFHLTLYKILEVIKINVYTLECNIFSIYKITYRKKGLVQSEIQLIFTAILAPNSVMVYRIFFQYMFSRMSTMTCFLYQLFIRRQLLIIKSFLHQALISRRVCITT